MGGLFSGITKHMIAAGVIVFAITDSMRPYGAKASIPGLGRIPTLIQGPPPGQGILDGLMSPKAAPGQPVVVN